jgi:hypothetical protein
MKLRFTIRDVLWLVVLIAVCLAWWRDHHVLTDNWIDEPSFGSGPPRGVDWDKYYIDHKKMHITGILPADNSPDKPPAPR